MQREREEGEKRLQSALEQIRKSNEKLSEDSEHKRNQSDKKFVGQIESLRESLRIKENDYDDLVRRQKEEAKVLRDKNQELL
jgi:hypothetical protein